MFVTICVLFLAAWLFYYFYWINRRIIPNLGGVVITGASTGIGEACATYLDKLGFTVFAGARQEKDLEKLQRNFAAGKRSKAIFMDVTDPVSLEKAAQTVETELQKANLGLIGLVNNAGVAVNGPLDALSESEIRNCIEVNVFGVLNSTNAFLPLLRKQQKFPSQPNLPQNLATVIHMGSAMGTFSLPFYGPYCMSKYALEAMTDAQRLELGESSGIRVTLARLGQIATPIFEKNKVRMSNNIKTMKNLDIYQNHLDILPRVADEVTKNAADPIIVAKAVEHALTCYKPKSRLRVGWEAWIMPTLWGFVPDVILDNVVILLFNIISKITKPKSE
eukprot:Phypoly_transcript_12185.p1 GENE.Phypoly_transcript_12185~~Phypoly_transcript_12185.p1  ORF type:complete len:334 (+),score=55.08 Phypoly_transcript_12185:88-1089(+)